MCVPSAALSRRPLPPPSARLATCTVARRATREAVARRGGALRPRRPSCVRRACWSQMGALGLACVPHLRGQGRLLSGVSGDDLASIELCFQQPRAKDQRLILKARNVLLATGSKAVRLSALESGGWYGREVGGHVRCYDSDSILRLSYLPRTVVVIGGGIIAVEFARIFAALNADVTMVVRAADLPSSLARGTSLRDLPRASLRAAAPPHARARRLVNASTRSRNEPRRERSHPRVHTRAFTPVRSTPTRSHRRSRHRWPNRGRPAGGP